MLHLRKGKKEIAKFDSMYDFANMTDLIINHFGEGNLRAVQNCACRNAFGMAIRGAKLRLGNGYIIEAC